MQFNKLRVTYGNRTVLNDVSLQAEDGKILAVLGESGAGKTTLLNACAGLISYEGCIDGIARTSYLFQGGCLLPNLTVEGNLRLVLDKSRWSEIPAVLERVGLKGREKDYSKKLSGGEQQRVAIARAFLFPHDVLLMDEPFSSLDLKLKSSLLLLVAELWHERKNTVIFVTHDVREAVLLSHRAIVLKGGEIKADVPLEYPLPRDFFAEMKEEKLLVQALMQ